MPSCWQLLTSFDAEEMLWTNGIQLLRWVEFDLYTVFGACFFLIYHWGKCISDVNICLWFAHFDYYCWYLSFSCVYMRVSHFCFAQTACPKVMDKIPLDHPLATQNHCEKIAPMLRAPFSVPRWSKKRASWHGVSLHRWRTVPMKFGNGENEYVGM